MYEYTAAQLGQNEAIAAQIAMLRELEQHEREATAAFAQGKKELKDRQGLEQDLARDIQYRLKVEQEAIAAAAKAEAKAMEERRAAANRALQEREAYYASILSGIHKTEEAERDARNKAILATQDAAKEFIALHNKEVADAVAAAEKKAIAEIEWTRKSVKERISILEQLQQYQANNAISPTTTTAKFGSAAVDNVGTLPALQASYAEELKKLPAHQKDAAHSAETLAEAWDKVTLSSSRVRSEMIVLAHEAVQGRFSRIPASMMVFAEYSNLSELALTRMGLAILGVVGVGATLLIFAAKGALEFDKFNASLVLAGGYSGMVTNDLYTMSKPFLQLRPQPACHPVCQAQRFVRKQKWSSNGTAR